MQHDEEKITYFAQTNSRGKGVPFGIKRRDRARHMYVIGKTGMGKSTLLENMAIQDIRNGEGMAFIDPHGSTADRIMEYVPEHRIKDVVYFAPFDMEHPIAFNVMEDVGYDKRHLVVSGLLSAFKKLWVDAFSARMEYILSNTLLALLEYPGATLLDVNRMLVNKNFRKKVVENIGDPTVKSFWTEEFANYTDRYTQEATPAIQNKIGQFTSNPLIRNIVGQPKSSFDLRKMMDDKKILIINLSKGRVGEVNANLIGSMLVTKIYLAAMSRADVSAKSMAELPPFYFYVDEFQNFANESFSDILSEARKYKLNLIIAHQYIEQMEEEVRDAVFGNVGTTVAFRVGPFDAEVLETIFSPQFTQADLVNLGMAQIYLTLMIDGVGSPPFSATTMRAFDPPPTSFVNDVIESSRLQFTKPRAEVEKALVEWSEPDSMAAKKAPATQTSQPAPHASSSGSHNPVTSTAAHSTNTPGASAPAQRSVHTAPVPIKEVAPRPVAVHAPAPTPAPAMAPRPKPVVPAPRPVEHQAKPPLGGTNSLREALASAMGKPAGVVQEPVRVPAQPQPPKTSPQPAAVHAPDLKETLGKIVGQGQAAHLPEKVLQEMLKVDETLDENT
ncbi:MAG: type IV secretion system DNA-binding domain-containing protein [Candidatus Adlerbacteria bacterium]|nr:type IV secretion system DNA-binding domain-containing protein [Candidatus Adlerbacteria bacterium]